MTCWSQFIALMFCHLAGARSLREIVGGLAASEGKLKHLGVERAPTRSTLAYANQHRPWQLYKTVFEALVQVCQAEARDKQRKFRFRHPLLSLDSTVIPVCASIVEERPQPPEPILRDEVIVLANQQGKQDPMHLRRIEIWLEEKKDTIVFVTNNLRLAASTIADIYRDRWQIELFFKAIKQSLRIKSFIGTSENAVQTQIWTALIAIVVLRYLQLRSTWSWSLSNLVALLRQQLFVYRDLWNWINQPFRPPVDLDDGQMELIL